MSGKLLEPRKAHKFAKCPPLFLCAMACGLEFTAGRKHILESSALLPGKCPQCCLEEVDGFLSHMPQILALHQSGCFWLLSHLQNRTCLEIACGTLAAGKGIEMHNTTLTLPTSPQLPQGGHFPVNDDHLSVNFRFAHKKIVTLSNRFDSY